jgi:SAM-dependent methyltransferase
VVALSAREHFERLWRKGDPWQTDSSAFEQAKYDRELELLAGRRYRRALEIGCGSGQFTRLLATIADEVVAIDIAESAIGRAREATAGLNNVDLRVADAVELDLAADGRWDLVTLGDTISSICWSRTFVEVACFAASLFIATAPDGRVLIADACGGIDGPEHRPWTVRTFTDLFLNVGYQLETAEVFENMKDDVEIRVSMSLLHKHAATAEQQEWDLWALDR